MNTHMNHIGMNRNGGAAYSPRHLQAPSAVAALFDEAAAMLNLWSARRRERRNVRQIDDHMLRDIGLDRFTAEQVGARPFWTA